MWGKIPVHYQQDAVLIPEEQEGLLKVGRMLGLYPRWWDRLPLKPISVMKARINGTLKQLDADDLVITKHGGVAGLEAEEVRNAAEMRGLKVLERDEQELRGDLHRWIQERKNHSVIDLIRVRSLPE